MLNWRLLQIIWNQLIMGNKIEKLEVEEDPKLDILIIFQPSIF